VTYHAGMKHLLALLLLLLIVLPVIAQAPHPASVPRLQTQTITYTHGEVELKGYLAKPGGVTTMELKPGILITPEWWGLNEYAKQRARELAMRGYIAFVLDPYGEGKNTNDPKQAGAWAGALYNDRVLFRARIDAGLRTLIKQPQVDPGRLAAIGFCFGGTASVELAYAGAPLRGIVAFHGNPLPPLPGDLERVQAHLFIAHGDVDPLVPDDQLDAFLTPLREAGTPFTLVRHGQAVHSFTNPGADAHNIPGVKYQAVAERLSMGQMYQFFDVIFDPTVAAE